MARGAERSFLGIDRLTWIDLHDWVGLLLAAVIVVHVGLNWRWVTKQTRLLLAGRVRDRQPCLPRA